MKSVLSDLRLKFAERTWNDTFRLVRRCMDKSRDDSRTHEPFIKSLERLQETFNVSSINTMTSRLEIIARQQGMGFHFTGHTCYLTADLFYLEVVLLPCGEVAEVKVATHGEPPVSCELFLQPLRSRNFAEFSKKLADVSSHYNIPGDNEIKFKLFASLQCIGKDLQKMSLLLREPLHFDPQVDMICHGSVGCLIAEREDCPLTIQFYVNSPNEMKTSDSCKVPRDLLRVFGAEALDPDSGPRGLSVRLGKYIYVEPAVQAAQVTVALSDATHKLQMASVIPQHPSVDPHGRPVFIPLGEAPCETLPACFLLKLQPPVPTLSSFVHKLSQITDVTIPDVDLQWAPLPKILLRTLSRRNGLEEAFDEQGSVVIVPPPGEMSHSCIFPGASWEVPAQRAAVVDGVPFTHPAHVPLLLELLRHQCAINTLLGSGIASPCAGPGSVCGLHLEVLPESDTSFSVTFHPPDSDSLAVLLVNVCGPHHLTCSLFGAGIKDPFLDEYISNVMRRCMSVPLTLKALYAKLEHVTAAAPSPHRPAATEAGNDPSATNNTVTSTVSSQNAAGTAEESFTVSAAACYAVSVAKLERLPEINTSPRVNPLRITTVGASPRWINDNDLTTELI